MRYRSRLLILALTVVAIACGGSSPTTPSPNPGGGTGGGGTGGGGTGGTTFTITSSGLNPRELTVPPGTRVTFINNDNVPHEMNSDPHPQHGDCPAIDQVSFLSAGQQKQSGNLTHPQGAPAGTTTRCGFHDHNRPDVVSLQGTIIITP